MEFTETQQTILADAWLLAREGKGRSVFATDEPFSDFALLHEAQRASDKKLIAFVENLEAEHLDESAFTRRSRFGYHYSEKGALLRPRATHTNRQHV